MLPHGGWNGRATGYGAIALSFWQGALVRKTGREYNAAVH